MKDDVDGCPAAMGSPDTDQLGFKPRRLNTILAGTAGVLLTAGGVVAALTMSAGAHLSNAPEAQATTVTATPGVGSPNRDAGFDLRRPQYTAAAPATPGQVECSPNTLRNACPPPRQLDQTSARAWFDKAEAPYMAIQTSLQRAGTEMQEQNIDGVRSACKQIRGNSQRLRATLPSPDERLTAEVGGAIDDLLTAADICLGPDPTSNVEALMSHVQSANAHFASAQQIIEARSP